MSVTIRCVGSGREMDIGYAAFAGLRCSIATAVDSALGKRYREYVSPPLIKEREELLRYYAYFDEAIDNGTVSEGVMDFLMQSDCAGIIDNTVASELLSLINKVSDTEVRGMDEFRELLANCAGCGSDVEWF